VRLLCYRNFRCTKAERVQVAWFRCLTSKSNVPRQTGNGQRRGAGGNVERQSESVQATWFRLRPVIYRPARSVVGRCGSGHWSFWRSASSLPACCHKQSEFFSQEPWCKVHLPPTCLSTNGMSHTCVYSQLQTVTAVCLVLISHATEGRRLSWPGLLLHCRYCPVFDIVHSCSFIYAYICIKRDDKTKPNVIK